MGFFFFLIFCADLSLMPLSAPRAEWRSVFSTELHASKWSGHHFYFCSGRNVTSPKLLLSGDPRTASHALLSATTADQRRREAVGTKTEARLSSEEDLLLEEPATGRARPGTDPALFWCCVTRSWMLSFRQRIAAGQNQLTGDLKHTLKFLTLTSFYASPSQLTEEADPLWESPPYI